jgi:hypothetical protein
MGAQSERDARMLRRFGGFDQETVRGTIKPGRGAEKFWAAIQKP